jgi:hypothetical protein
LALDSEPSAERYFLVYLTYVMERFGEATPPRELQFLVVVAGFAGSYHQKRKIFGGLAALQTSLRTTAKTENAAAGR